MKVLRKFAFLLAVMSLVLAACTPAATEAPVVEQPVVPTEAPAEAPTEVVVEEPAGLTWDKTVEAGLITDASSALAIYGAHILRSLMLGMEYAAVRPAPLEKSSTWPRPRKTPSWSMVARSSSTSVMTAAILRTPPPSRANWSTCRVSKFSSVLFPPAPPPTAGNCPGEPDPVDRGSCCGKRHHRCELQRIHLPHQPQQLPGCDERMCCPDPAVHHLRPDRAYYAFGQGSAAPFRDACTFEGAEFVADDILAPLDTLDFTPYMEQIANSGAEAYIVTWAGSGFVSLVQAARDQGVTESMALGATFIENVLMSTFFSNAVGATAGILYHYTAPRQRRRWANTKPRYGVNPDLFDGDGMNAASLVVEAIKATGGDASGDALKRRPAKFGQMRGVWRGGEKARQ